MALLDRQSFDYQESDYAWMAFGYHRTGQFDKLQGVLTKLQETERHLHEPCLRAIAGFFLSAAAQKVFDQGGALAGQGVGWSVKYVHVDAEGNTEDGARLS